LARTWQGRIPVIYGSAPLTEAVARRWKTQINENAKQPAFYNTLSELHHNEIMGWEDRDLQQLLTYAFVRDPEEHPQIAKRFEISRDLLEERGRTVLEYQGEGGGFLARMMGLIYLGDWASFYLAVLNGVDPTPVELIEELKRRLV
jgi:glucose/mannose-6-phosphate isomerase